MVDMFDILDKIETNKTFSKRRLLRVSTLNDECLGIYKVREVYDDKFYHKYMPTLEKRACKKILKKLSYKKIKPRYATLYLEWVYSGKGTIQRIYEKDTILDF